MDDFKIYERMKQDGKDPNTAYLHAKENGLEIFSRIRMLRSVYKLSLEEAKKISFKADTGNDLENHDKNNEEFLKILDNELGK